MLYCYEDIDKTTKDIVPLSEKFFDYYTGKTYFGSFVQLFIYENPDPSEWVKYIAQDGRGWISPDGNLYMEGYEIRGSMTQVIHSDLLNVLSRKGLCSSNYANFYYQDRTLLYNISTNGLLVQRESLSKTLYLAETYQPVPLRKRRKDLEMVMENFYKMNPSIHIKQEPFKNPEYSYGQNRSKNQFYR
jgi:hypothetical protein